MCYIDAYNKISSDPWLKMRLKKLSNSDFILIKDFINKNKDLSSDGFEMAINRMFLDKEKPKNWTLIMEVLSAINTLSKI